MPFQITVTKTYNTTNLFEDIKGLYKVAGVKGQPVAFIFTDNEVKEEGFLEYINQILMTGEVAGLFQKDELDAIVNDIRPIMKAESPGKSRQPIELELLGHGKQDLARQQQTILHRMQCRKISFADPSWPL